MSAGAKIQGDALRGIAWLDGRYLRLDCTNDPLTGNFDVGANSLTVDSNLFLVNASTDRVHYRYGGFAGEAVDFTIRFKTNTTASKFSIFDNSGNEKSYINALGQSVFSQSSMATLLTDSIRPTTNMFYIHFKSTNPATGYIEIRDSADVQVGRITCDGQFAMGAALIANSQLSIISKENTYVSLRIRNKSGQTANLTNWEDSAGNLIASVDISGNFYVAGNLSFQFRDAQLYVNSDNDGDLDLHADVAVEVEAPVLVLPVKTDTGDPAGQEGAIYVNTFDNALRLYADAAWRNVLTW
jgi:hypothetical protein